MAIEDYEAELYIIDCEIEHIDTAIDQLSDGNTHLEADLKNKFSADRERLIKSRIDMLKLIQVTKIKTMH